MTEHRKIEFRCAECGSADHLKFDEYAEWNAETQVFELIDVYQFKECKPVCESEDCMGEEVEFYRHDIETAEKLDIAPGIQGYVPIAQAKEAWKKWNAKIRQREEEKESSILLAKMPKFWLRRI